MIKRGCSSCAKKTRLARQKLLHQQQQLAKQKNGTTQQYVNAVKNQKK